tara:strand:- start:101 stop:382 length:282 start_codon:yes stop_codon:yes gene_type:complete
MIIKESKLRSIIREFMGLGTLGRKKKGGSGGSGGGSGGDGDWMGHDYEQERYRATIQDPEDEYSREGNYEDRYSEWDGDDDDGDDDGDDGDDD